MSEPKDKCPQCGSPIEWGTKGGAAYVFCADSCGWGYEGVAHLRLVMANLRAENAELRAIVADAARRRGAPK